VDVILKNGGLWVLDWIFDFDFFYLPWVAGADDALGARIGHPEYVEIRMGERGAERLRERFLERAPD
jgi:hypothetical protein